MGERAQASRAGLPRVGARGAALVVRLLLCLAVTTWAAERPGLAQQAGSAPLECGRGADKRMACQLDAADQLDQQVRALVESGFTNELVYRLYLFPAEDDEPAAASVVVFAAVFELYTDVYYVSREGVEGYVEADSWPDAVDQLSRFEVVLEGGEELPAGEYFAAAVLEVNPVNEEQLLEARRWIAQSRGGYRLFDSRESSLFGTFVSLFVNVDLGSADARRVFRSETFEIAP